MHTIGQDKIPFEKSGLPLVDYCASCRRHVNGALSCPGCGTYFLVDAPTAERAAPATASPEAAAPVAVAVGGRAARRRHLAQLKKHKRRAATATVFALVGGGLTLAAMPSGASAKHASAASAAQPVDQVGAPSGTAGSQPRPTGPATAPQQSAPASAAAIPTTRSTPLAQPSSAASTQVVTPAGTQAVTRQVPAHTAAAPPVTHTTHAPAPTTPAAAPTSAPTTAPAQPNPTTSSPATNPANPPSICVLGLVCVN